MRSAVIETNTEKGRSFHSTLLAYVEADSLWPGGATATETLRPVWAMFGGSDQANRAFVANLTSGRKITVEKETGSYYSKEEKMEFLKSAGYQVAWQREEEGSIVTVYLPEVFRLDPGMVDPNEIKFVLLPSREWCATQNLPVDENVQHVSRLGYNSALTEDMLRSLVPLSYLFAAYVDRRTRAPLVTEGKFYLQLLLRCLQAGLATLHAKATYARQEPFGQHSGIGFREHYTDSVGLNFGIAMQCTHAIFEEVLAAEVSAYYAKD